MGREIPYKDLERESKRKQNSLSIYRCLVYFLVFYNLGMTVVFGLSGWFALERMSRQDENIKLLEDAIHPTTTAVPADVNSVINV